MSRSNSLLMILIPGRTVETSMQQQPGCHRSSHPSLVRGRELHGREERRWLRGHRGIGGWDGAAAATPSPAAATRASGKQNSNCHRVVALRLHSRECSSVVCAPGLSKELCLTMRGP